MSYYQKRIDTAVEKLRKIVEGIAKASPRDMDRVREKLRSATDAVLAAHNETKRYETLGESGDVFRDVSQRSLLCVRLSTPGNWMLLTMFDTNAKMTGRVCLDKKTVGKLARLVRQLEEEEMIE